MAAASIQIKNPTFAKTLASSKNPSFLPFRSSSLSVNYSSTATNFKSIVSRVTPSTIVPRAAASSSAETQVRKTFHGLCYVVGDNIDTDQIIPAEYLTFSTSNPADCEKLGSYALIGLPDSYNERFVEQVEIKSKHSIIIGGENFGCGSSREHAPVCLGAAGAKAVVAQSYARIFFRNSVATGEVYPLESESRVCEECKTGDVASVELREGNCVLINHTTGKEYKLKAIGDAGPVIDAGGIFDYARTAGMIPSPVVVA
ncbi:PREDICTED: 3-isopropylmalate dehydratase small subunit 3-like [Camelina sativa]|uniref:3-isopropylmalate dehydratase small subunit 3-like n=1 Tax=Camelina sativa TaxID=90675 RepID=A0ABM0YRK1_CAMSA|nr:PREDICTED: 3-isopropylmalate dehydratase small subunit 3-like [Camelina sativa]